MRLVRRREAPEPECAQHRDRALAAVGLVHEVILWLSRRAERAEVDVVPVDVLEDTSARAPSSGTFGAAPALVEARNAIDPGSNRFSYYRRRGSI